MLSYAKCSIADPKNFVIIFDILSNGIFHNKKCTKILTQYVRKRMKMRIKEVKRGKYEVLADPLNIFERSWEDDLIGKLTVAQA